MDDHRGGSAMAEEHNHELTERIQERKIHPVARQTGGDPEAGRRDAKAWYPHRH